MEITLIQGLIIAALTILFCIDYEMEGFFIFRPIIVCPVIGLVLGDLNTGLIAGGLVELAFAGITPVGGVTPPDAVFTSIMTVVLAKTTAVPVASAFVMAYPFGLLKQTLGTLFCTFYAFLNKKADKFAEEANLKGIYRISITALVIVALTSGVLSFLAVYAAQQPLKELVEMLPEWLTNGLDVAGGMIPAIGFAMLLRVMLKGRYVPYLIAGFLFATFIPIDNILPVAMMGASFAGLAYYATNEVKSKKGGSVNEGI